MKIEALNVTASVQASRKHPTTRSRSTSKLDGKDELRPRVSFLFSDFLHYCVFGPRLCSIRPLIWCLMHLSLASALHKFRMTVDAR